MKLGLFTLMLSFPSLFFAQDNKVTSNSNSYTMGNTKVEKFDNNARRFNDWSISLGGGTAFLHHSDLTSFNRDGNNFGWNAYVELGKQLSDKFGFLLQYQKGKTTQTARLGDNIYNLPYNAYGLATASTKYDQVSLLGDFNFSNLFRRIDNNSPFRWALHGYAGVGFQGYSYERSDEKPLTQLPNGTSINETYRAFKQKFSVESFFYQGGLGLKYNLSKRIDLEGRVMYIVTGDDEFDGGGEDVREWPGYNQRVKNTSDNLVTVNLGIIFKLGKHSEHLAWYDSYNTAIDKLDVLASRSSELVVCEKGDADNDGVCDDWDRELNTIAGARVDGSGKALDMDLDGVIDLKDKCVTVPGLVENNGCPYIDENTLVIVDENTKKFYEGIVFDLDKATLTSMSIDKLNIAAEILKKSNKNARYLVIAATDTRASESYNLELSNRRAQAVIKYLISRGVDSKMLIGEGRGEKDLKYPECEPATKCPEWKNEANRRVYFELIK